jgi:hypothetical protein
MALGSPLTVQADGALAHVIPAPLDQLVKAGTTQDVTLGRLTQLDGSLWALPVGVALLLLLAGVLTAVRTPLRHGAAGAERQSPQLESPRRAAVATAVRLGPALAVALPALLWLCRVRVRADLSVFGFDAAGAGMTLEGNLLSAAFCGLLWGAVAGFAGSLLVSRFAAAKRPSTAGTGPQAAGFPVTEPAGTGRPAAPGPFGPGPAVYPPHAPLTGYDRPGDTFGRPPADAPQPYGGLPGTSAPTGPAPGHNPYAAGGDSGGGDLPFGGFNPYTDGPVGAPPPPPAPPGHDAYERDEGHEGRG